MMLEEKPTQAIPATTPIVWTLTPSIPTRAAIGDLSVRIRAAPGGRLGVHVVSREDRYETTFRDGHHGYFVRAFFDEAAAR